MAFNKIIPPAKPEKVKGGTAMVRIAVSVTKKGVSKAVLSLADSQLTALGWDKKEITHVVVYEGTDDDYGNLRIEVAKDNDEGAVKLAKMKYGGARFYPHKFAVQPNKKIGVLPCAIQATDDTGIVVALPLLDWTNAGVIAKQEARQVAVRQEAQQRQVADVGKLTNILGKDIVGDVFCKPIEYLAKKGIQCAKLNGDWWQYRPDGAEAERISTDDLILRINKFRNKVGLKPVAKYQIVQEVI